MDSTGELDASVGRYVAHWSYEAYATTTVTSTGTGGWIPAGDDAAPQASRDVRAVRIASGYVIRGWWVDSCQRYSCLFALRQEYVYKCRHAGNDGRVDKYIGRARAARI